MEPLIEGLTMAEIFVGSIAVGVVPDLRGFNDRMRSELVPAANNIGREMGQAIAKGIADSLNIGRTIRDAVVRDARTIATAGTDAGRLFAVGFKNKFDAELRGYNPKVKVDVSADTTAARAEIARLSGVITERVRTVGGGGVGVPGRTSSGGGGGSSGLGITAGQAIGIGSLALVAGGGLGIVPALVAASAGIASFGALAYPTIHGISSAMQQVTTDTNAYDRATTKAGKNTALAHIKADLAGLSPAQRFTVTQIQALNKEFDKLAKTFAPTALEVFNDGLKLANSLLPILMRFGIEAGMAIHSLLREMTKFTQTQGFKDFINTMAGMSGPAIIAIGDAIGHLAVAIGKLLLALISPGSLSVFTGIVDALAWSLVALGNAYAFLTKHVNPGILHDIGMGILAIYVATKLAAIGMALWKNAIVVWTVVTKIAAAVQWLFNAAMDANPIGLVILAIAALALATYELVKHWKAVTEFFKTMWHGAQIAWGIAWSYFSGLVKRGTSYVASQLGVMQHEIAHDFDTIRHTIAHVWDLIYQDTVGKVIRLHQWIQRQINILFHNISGIYDQIRHAISTAWDTVWNNTVGRTKRGVQDVINTFVGLKNWVTNFFSGAIHWLVNAGRDIMTGLWNGIKSVWNDVASWFKGMPHAILHALGIASPPLWSIGAGKNIMQGILRGLAHGVSDVKGFFVGLARDITGPLKAVWGGLMGVGKGIWHAIFGGGSGVKQWAGTVAQALGMLGLPLSLSGDVLYQMQTESAGNANAINLTDINAQLGDPSKGLMQVIGATFQMWHVPGTSWNIYDPLANIAAALNYAQHGKGFGTGMGQIGSGHGYDQGGLWPHGTFGWNLSGGTELVLNQNQLMAYAAGQASLHSAALNTGPVYNAHFDSLTGAAIEGHVRTAYQAMSLHHGYLNRQGRRN